MARPRRGTASQAACRWRATARPRCRAGTCERGEGKEGEAQGEAGGEGEEGKVETGE